MIKKYIKPFFHSTELKTPKHILFALKRVLKQLEPERTLVMIKQIAWNTFKSTGNINTLLELLEVDKTLEKIDKIDEMQMIRDVQKNGIMNFNYSNKNNKIKL